MSEGYGLRMSLSRCVIAVLRPLVCSRIPEQAGAIVHPTLSPSHITLGIKETPLSEVLTDPIHAPSDAPERAPPVARTHLMFSHTVKGQLYNMELLSKFLGPQKALTPRLIDYELLTGGDGKRTVGFGWFAGG